MGLGAMQTLNTAGITAAATEGLRMLRMDGRKCNCTHKDLEGLKFNKNTHTIYTSPNVLVRHLAAGNSSPSTIQLRTQP